MATPAGSRRALIVKMGAIGDVVMAIPGARALYEQGWAVDWVIGGAAAPVLRLYPWINAIEVDEAKLLRGSAGERFAHMRALWARLRGTAYELCATLYFDPRYRLLTWPVKARRKVILSKTDRELTLLPGRHHTDEYARILLGQPDAQRPMQLAPVRPDGLPENPLPRAAEGRVRVVLVPGGARNVLRDDALRRWPVERYVELARLLLRQGCEVVLSGGPQDAWAAEPFAGLDVVDVTGRLSLPETLALFESADLVCTHDTGPLHLAGVTSAAVLALFGPVDPHGRLPHRANALALWGGEGFACRPCYDGRDYAPGCTDNLCIQQITPEDALGHALRLLEARRSGQPLGPAVLEPSAWRGRKAEVVPVSAVGQAGVPALFLDRDGVINEETNYLYRAEDVRWVEGIFPLVRTAAELGYRVVVVTNQAGIARGYYTVEQFHELMDWMRAEFVARGCRLDGVYFSPYHPKGEIEEFAREHEDRKPGPGMFRRAAQDLRLDLGRSVLVGDRCSDIAAAHAAGLRKAFLLRGTEVGPCPEEAQVIEALGEAEAWLREQTGRG